MVKLVPHFRFFIKWYTADFHRPFGGIMPCKLKRGIDIFHRLHILDILDILYNHLMKLMNLMDILMIREPFEFSFLWLMLVVFIQHFPQRCHRDKDAAADTYAGNAPRVHGIIHEAPAYTEESPGFLDGDN